MSIQFDAIISASSRDLLPDFTSRLPKDFLDIRCDLKQPPHHGEEKKPLLVQRWRAIDMI